MCCLSVVGAPAPAGRRFAARLAGPHVTDLMVPLVRDVDVLGRLAQQLLAIVDDWSLARNIESFFEGAERRASTLPADELAATRDRLNRARDVLGGTNASDRFHEWKSPDERE
jgi:hypothetical protein